MSALHLQKPRIDQDQTLNEFYSSHYDVVFRAAYTVTHNAQDAEDVVQNVFMKAMRHPEGCQPARNVKAYLFRIAVNEARDLIKARIQASAANDEYGRRANTCRSAGEAAARNKLHDAMAELTPEELEMMVLRYEFGHSENTIAEKLGYSSGNIAVILFRARFRLRRLLGLMGDEASPPEPPALKKTLSAGGGS